MQMSQQEMCAGQLIFSRRHRKWSVCVCVNAGSNRGRMQRRKHHARPEKEIIA